jgi:hypothetical protein
MEPITYKYSAFRTVFITVFIFVFDIFVAYGAITTTGGDRMVTLVGVLILFGALIYVLNKIFLPTLRGEMILKIDEEKMQYTFKDLTLYWKDIEDLDYEDYSFGRAGWTSFKVRFTIKDGGREKRISTWFIAGDNAAIFDSILTTFLKYR